MGGQKTRVSLKESQMIYLSISSSLKNIKQKTTKVQQCRDPYNVSKVQQWEILQ
jgi:hypothetical protein